MRLRHPILLLLTLLALAILYLPVLAVAATSFNSASFGLHWQGFTLSWYTRAIHDAGYREAAGNTLILACVSTFFSTILGTLLALGMARFPWPRWAKGFYQLNLYYPVVTPDIIFAAAMVIAFAVLRHVSPIFLPGLLNMTLAHITFQISFVALVVHSRLAVLGSTLDEAARDLYAGAGWIFFKVTLPLIAPAIAAGAMLAFTLSLDDFMISLLTAGPDSQTLPLLIQSRINGKNFKPDLQALSTLIFGFTVFLVLGLERLTRKREPSF